MAAGWPCHAQNVENAGSLPQHVPQRKQMPGGGQEPAACPGPPPHTCCPLMEGQALALAGRMHRDRGLTRPGHNLPHLDLRGSWPRAASLLRV